MNAHRPYWHEGLTADYCVDDGEPWPCLHYRQTRPPKCKCSHPRHDDQCWQGPCGCREYRPEDAGTPARFQELYDPSPEPIDRRVQ